MQYRLIIDVGNSTTKYALFDNKELTQYFQSFDDLSSSDIQSTLEKFNIDRCLISQSGKLSEELMDWLENVAFEVIYFDSNLVLPIKLDYETPQTLGKDRIASAVGSLLYFPDGNTVVVDMGTCITMNYIDANSTFLGGNISPGISMRLQAMHYFTEKLPLVEKKFNENLIGQNTENALQNGAVRGALWEIESFIRNVQEKNGPVNVILTGGDAKFFESCTNIKIFAAPKLVLEGLNEILTFNAF